MLLVVAATAYLTGRQFIAASEVGTAVRSEPTIHVEVAPIRVGRMNRTWSLFGTVSALSNTTHTYSLPFEARIDRLHVADGQHVEANAPLFDVSRSLLAKVAAAGAMDRLEEARQILGQVAGRESDGLATREELIQAEGRLRRAEQQVDAMRQSGQLEEELTVRSSRSGVITIGGNQVGALIPAGTAVMSIAEDAMIGVELWAEPTDARAIHSGTKVSIESLARGSTTSFPGHVVRVDERVDARTRLVRVSIGLDLPGALILGQSVRGRMAVDAADGLVVPRESIVASDGLSRIFTVVDGYARERPVNVIIDGHDEVLVGGASLEEGDEVVTRGAYQCEDGLRVEIDR